MSTRALQQGHLMVTVTGLVLVSCLAVPSGLNAREFRQLTPAELHRLLNPCGNVDKESATRAKEMVEKPFYTVDGGGSATETVSAAGNASPVAIDDESVGANTGLKFLD